MIPIFLDLRILFRKSSQFCEHQSEFYRFPVSNTFLTDISHKQYAKITWKHVHFDSDVLIISHKNYNNNRFDGVIESILHFWLSVKFHFQTEEREKNKSFSSLRDINKFTYRDLHVVNRTNLNFYEKSHKIGTFRFHSSYIYYIKCNFGREKKIDSSSTKDY